MVAATVRGSKPSEVKDIVNTAKQDNPLGRLTFFQGFETLKKEENLLVGYLFM